MLKASLVDASNKPGVSVAAIALANGVNANLLRRWIANAESGADGRQHNLLPSPAETMPVNEAFIAVPLAQPSSPR